MTNLHKSYLFNTEVDNWAVRISARKDSKLLVISEYNGKAYGYMFCKDMDTFQNALNENTKHLNNADSIIKMVGIINNNEGRHLK